VFDKNNGNQWQSRPKSIAFEKDYHTIETNNGKDFSTFEEAFSEVEGNAKQIIDNIINTYEMPARDSEDYNWLINFIALLCERTPSRRNHFNESMEEVLKKAVRVGFNHNEYFENSRRRIEEKNGEKLNINHEQMKEYINSDNFKISFNNNFNMENFLARLDAIIDLLGERKWSVCVSPPMNGDFICSDNPVCLRDVTPVKGVFSSPGHGILNTEVSIPLNPRVMLLGRFEDYLPPMGYAPNRKFVAQMNSMTAMYAERYVFSRENDFLWWDINGNVCTIADYKKRLEDR